MSRPCASLLLVALAVAPAAAEPGRRIDVRVVDVAADRAYVAPGERAGLRPGATIEVAGVRYRVVEVTAQHAVASCSRCPRAGQTGWAEAAAPAPAGQRMPAPRALAEFRHQWPDPRPPALDQRPAAVRLGGGASAPLRGALLVAARSAASREGHASAVELGARVSYAPLAVASRPVGLDADASALLYSGRPGESSAERPPARVRELRLRWGERADPALALGRLARAAGLLGPIDGVRAAAPIGAGLELAAFGGAVPAPLSGAPDLDAIRFGSELRLARDDLPWRPTAALAVHGSTWRGELDERRLDVEAGAARGPLALDAHAELSAFPRANPWQAGRLELTAAGAAAGVRLGGDARMSADLGLRRPDRSLRLAAFLPPEWLCSTEPGRPGETETCRSDDVRLHGSLGLGRRFGRLSLDAGGTAIRGLGTTDLSGFAAARLAPLGRARLEVGAGGGKAGFLDWGALRIGAGASLARGVDVDAHYRPVLLRYTASLDSIVEQRAGIDLRLSARDDMDLTLAAEGASGADVRALLVFAAAVWRFAP